MVGEGPFLGGEAILLDARESYDPEDDRLHYTWRQLSGPPVPLGTRSSDTLLVAAPNEATTLRFALQVSDGSGADEVEVSVEVEPYEGQAVSHAENPFLHHYGVQAGDIVRGGDVLYAALGDEGVAVFDVSDPQRPVRLGGYSESGFTCDALALHGDVLLAAGDSTPAHVRLLDVSDPEAPTKLSEFRTPAVRSALLTEDRAYIGTSWPEAMRIYDISEPRSPSLLELGDAAGVVAAEALALSGDRLLLGSGTSVVILDVGTSPPQRLGVWESPNEVWSIVVDDDVAFVGDGGGGVFVLDFSDPAQPQVLASDEEDAALHVERVDDLLYVANGYKGMRVYDVSNRARLELIGEYASPDRLMEVTIHRGYAISHMLDSLQALALGAGASHYAMPDWIPTTSPLAHVVLAGNTAWTVSDEEEEVWRLDLRDAGRGDEPPEVELVREGEDVAVHGPWVFVSNASVDILPRGLAHAAPGEALDELEPNGLLNDDFYVANALLAVDQRLYVCERENVRVIDITDPEAPVRLGSVHVSPVTQDMDVLDGVGAVAASKDVHFLDLSDPTDPQLLGSHTFDYYDQGFANGVAIVGQNVIVADGHETHNDEGAVRVLDFSDPSAPRLRGQVLERATVAVELAGPYAYLPERFPAGVDAAPVPMVSIIDIADLDALRVAGRLPLRGAPSDVAVTGSELVVSSEVGLNVLPRAPRLSPLRASASSGERLDYTLAWERLPIEAPLVDCYVTGGRCEVDSVAEGEAVLHWEVESGDHELVVVLGEGHAFISVKDRLRVR